MSRLILALVFTGLCCAGCKTASHKDAVPPAPRVTIIPHMTITATGAVIVKHTKTTLHYKKHCESCGNTSDKVIGTGVGGTLTSEYDCPKCRNKQAVKIDMR